MSLTHILKSKHTKELRDRLKTDFPRPKISISGELIVPPLTVNYGVVGTAFDYLMRFQLEKCYPDKIDTGNREWVATGAINAIKKRAKPKKTKPSEINFADGKEDTPEEKAMYAAILTASSRVSANSMSNYYKKVIDGYKAGKKAYAKYIKGGVFSDDLVNGALVLGKLDLYIRAGILEASISANDNRDVDDLSQLYNLIKIEQFEPQKVCYLNPTFGKGSGMFGGADADFIIDDTLIDIKTTKLLKIERRQINQLLCYYMASRIGGINGDPTKKDTIKKIGIYFSRYGLLWTIALEEFGDEATFANFEEWIKTYLKFSK